MDCTAPRHTQTRSLGGPERLSLFGDIQAAPSSFRNMTYGHPQESRRQLWQPMAADLLAVAPLDLGRGRRNVG